LGFRTLTPFTLVSHRLLFVSTIRPRPLQARYSSFTYSSHHPPPHSTSSPPSLPSSCRSHPHPPPSHPSLLLPSTSSFLSVTFSYSTFSYFLRCLQLFIIHFILPGHTSGLRSFIYSFLPRLLFLSTTSPFYAFLSSSYASISPHFTNRRQKFLKIFS
jgi:hypothetical protein